jgi:hypothetical protein
VAHDPAGPRGRPRAARAPWLYDEATRTLFTSDSFSHVVPPAEAESCVLASGDPDPTTVEVVREHLRAKFAWLVGADVSGIRASVEAVFAEREIEIVAPSYGCVLQGRAVVERHLGLLLEALDDLASGTVPAGGAA